MVEKKLEKVSRPLFLFGFLALFSSVLFAQTEVYERPVYFNQYFNDPQVNSNNFYNRDKAAFSLAHRRNSNDFGGVNTSIFSLDYSLKQKGKSFGVIGLQFMNDTEGELIKRNRVLPFYTQHLQATSRYNIAGGIGLGFYNFLISSDGSFGGASDFALDISFLIKYYSEKTNIQFQVNQAANSKVVPVSQEIILGRSFNLLIDRYFRFSDQFAIKPSVYSRFSKDLDLPLSGFGLGGGTHLIFADLVTAGMTYEYESGYNFFAGIKRIKLGESRLKFELSYFVPSAESQRTNVQMFEIVVKYLLNKKKNEK